jgi:hypothetical protein
MTHQHVASGNCDLIDYIIISKPAVARYYECYVGECIGSDHLPVHLNVKLQYQIKTVAVKEVRVLAKCDRALFSAHLADASSEYSARALASEADIDERCDEIRIAITQAIDLACPKRKVKDFAFRLRPETVSLIRLKRKLRRMSQRTGDPRYRTMYNNINRQVTAAVQKERQNAWHEVTASLDETDGRSFWQKFKMLSGVAKHSGAKHTRVEDENGELTSDCDKVASLFAENLRKMHVTHNGPMFCDATKTEVERHVQDHIGDYSPRYTVESERGDSDPLVDIIDVAEVAAALKLCKSNSAPGPDGIPYSVLKMVPQCTLSDMAMLFTACVTFGYFPKIWKSATGVMLPKPGKDAF